MLEAAGYPIQNGAMPRISKELGVPRRTLLRWWKGTYNDLDSDLSKRVIQRVQEKKPDLIAAIRAEIEAVLEEMGRAREEASHRDLSVAFGILVDKHQLLTGGPTENVNQRIVQLVLRSPESE